MNRATEITTDQLEACIKLFKAVSVAQLDAVRFVGNVYIDAALWANICDAHAEVAEQWDWQVKEFYAHIKAAYMAGYEHSNEENVLQQLISKDKDHGKDTSSNTDH